MSAASPLFLGGHPGIDFLNTSFAPHGAQMEVIGNGRDLLNWMVQAELLSKRAANNLAQRIGAAALDASAAEARKLRERTRQWLTSWRQRSGRRSHAAEVEDLSKLIERGVWRRRVIATAGGLSITERLDAISADALLALLGWQIALLITQEDASRIKECAGAACTLWFVDRTKAHRRVFCSPAVCGNRAKVAAFRDRQRQNLA